MINGIILIDAWESSKEIVNQWYETLVPKILEICPDPYFINACYNNCWDYCDNGVSLIDYSQYNLLRLYHKLDNQGEDPAVIDSLNFEIPYNVMKYCKGLNKTADCFKHLFNKSNCIFLTESQDFKFHSQRYLKNKIQNWLVVGRAWQICLHYRQMGFNHLKNIVDDNTNFFIAPWGCLDEYNQLITTKHIQSDNLKWSKVSDELWQLIK